MTEKNLTTTVKELDSLITEVKSVIGGVERLQGTLNIAKSKVERLEAIKSEGAAAATRYQSEVSALDQTNSKIIEYKKQLKELTHDAEKAGVSVEDYWNTINRKKHILEKLETIQKRQIKTLKETRKAIEDAGYDKENPVKEGNLIDIKAAHYNKKIEIIEKRVKKQTEIDEKAKKRTAFINDLKTNVENLKPIQSLVDGSLKRNKSLEHGTVELSDSGVKDTGSFVAAGQAAQSRYAGIDTKGFLDTAAALKKEFLLFSDQTLLDVTNTAAAVATASKVLPQDAADALKTGFSTFRDEFGTLSESGFAEAFGASLSAATSQFEIPFEELSAALKENGAQTAAGGIGMSEQLAVIGMTYKGMGTEAASAALAELSANAASAQGAFNQLSATTGNDIKVDLLDEGGKLKAFPEALANLRARYGDTIDEAEHNELAKAFGSDKVAELVYRLWDQDSALSANSQTLAEAAKNGNKFTAALAANTTASLDGQVKLLDQSLNALQQTIGKQLAPVMDNFKQIAASGLASAIGALTPYINEANQAFTTWANNNPGLMQAIGGTALVVQTLGQNIGPIAASLQGLSNVVTLSQTVFSQGKTAILSFGNGIKTLTLFMMANPLLLALTALAGVVLYVANQWDSGKSFLENVSDGILSLLADLGGMLFDFVNWILSIFDINIGKIFDDFIESIKNKFPVLKEIGAVVSDIYGNFKSLFFSDDSNNTVTIDTQTQPQQPQRKKRGAAIAGATTLVATASAAAPPAAVTVAALPAAANPPAITATQPLPAANNQNINVSMSYGNIVIQAPQGADSQQITREVQRILDENARKTASTVRSSLYDGIER